MNEETKVIKVPFTVAQIIEALQKLDMEIHPTFLCPDGFESYVYGIEHGDDSCQFQYF